MVNTSNRYAIYITLVCIGILLTIAAVILMSFNLSYFALLFTLYLLGCSIYMFVFLAIKRNVLDDDVRYNVASYISLFNIFFSVSMFILGAIFIVKTKKTYK